MALGRHGGQAIESESGTQKIKVSTCDSSRAISGVAPSSTRSIGFRKIKFVGNQECRGTDRIDFAAVSDPASCSDQPISKCASVMIVSARGEAPRSATVSDFRDSRDPN
jgi:hypothetical protein